MFVWTVFASDVECVWNLMAHGDAREGKWRGNWRMEWVASILTLPRNMVYPALLTLMRTPRLPAVDWTDAPADLNGLVRSPKDEIWFLRLYHHVSNALYQHDRLAMSKIFCELAHELTHSFLFEILYWLNDGVKTRSARLFVCFWRNSPPVGQGLLIHEVSRSHTTTHHSR